MTAVQKAPADYPGGKHGYVLTVEFTILGISCLGLNGGPAFSDAFSFQIVQPINVESGGDVFADVCGKTRRACPI